MATRPDIANLEMWWALEEASGNRADSHTGGYTLTDNNTVTSATGKQGTAASFASATAETLSRTDGAEFDFLGGGNDFTITAWLYPGTFLSQDIRIICKSSGASRQLELLRIYNITPANEKLRFICYNTLGGSAQSEMGGALTASTWYFVAMRFKGSTGSVDLRVDGTNQTAGTLGGTMRDGTAGFRLGNADGFGNGYYNGRLDEVNAWSAYLTTDELDWLYNSGSGRAYSEMLLATLTPTVLAGAPTIVAPSASWSVTLAPAALDVGAAIRVPGMTATVTLTPSPVAGAPAIVAPGMTALVTLSPAPVAAAPVILDPTASHVVTLSQTILGASPAIAAPTVVATVTLAAAALGLTPTALAAALHDAGIELDARAAALVLDAAAHALELDAMAATTLTLDAAGHSLTLDADGYSLVLDAAARALVLDAEDHAQTLDATAHSLTLDV